MKRESGYYWVKYKGNWLIAWFTTKGLYADNEWSSRQGCVSFQLYHEELFDEVNETRILAPDEIADLEAATTLLRSAKFGEDPLFMFMMQDSCLPGDVVTLDSKTGLLRKVINTEM